jgi:hypothetical protein
MRVPAYLLSLLLPLALGAQAPEPAPAETPAAPATEPATPPAVPEAPPVVSEAPSTQAQPAAEAAQGAVLLVYREKRFAGAILNTSVFVDGVEVADMDNGTYLKVKVTPGDHTICGDEKKDELALTIEAGKTYYFRMALRAGFWKGHGKLEPVDEATGEKEFTGWKAKLVYAKDIRKPDMVIKD